MTKLMQAVTEINLAESLKAEDLRILRKHKRGAY